MLGDEKLFRSFTALDRISVKAVSPDWLTQWSGQRKSAYKHLDILISLGNSHQIGF